MNNKVIVLIEEDPIVSTFKEVAEHLGLEGINPLDFINPESHMLSNIYRNVFTDSIANELMGYLIHKHDGPLVYEVFAAIQKDDERLVLVNTTLLVDEDIKFLVNTLPHVLSYKISEQVNTCATDIYNGSKAYRDEVGI